MPLTPLSDPTKTGVFAHGAVGGRPHVSGPVLVPSPSCPAALLPHATTVPSLNRARLCSAPAASAVAGAVDAPILATLTGRSLEASPLLPSCPVVLKPQASTAPPLTRASAWDPPVVIAIAPLSPLTGTGTSLFPPIDPLPSCPSSSLPQATTVPFSSR